MVRRKSVVRVPERSRLSPADQLAIALFCLAGVITLILYVVEKSPSSVCLCSAGIAALLIYPILHFIRDHRMRVAAFVVTFILSVAIAYASWPNVQTQPDTPVTSGNFKEVVTGLLVRFPARVVDVPDDRPGTTHLTAWTVNGRKFDLYYSPSVAEDKMAVGLEFPIPQEVLTAQNNPVSYTHLDVYKRQAVGCQQPGPEEQRAFLAGPESRKLVGAGERAVGVLHDVGDGEVVGEDGVDEGESGCGDRDEAGDTGTAGCVRQAFGGDGGGLTGGDEPEGHDACEKIVGGKRQSSNKGEASKCCHV